jgi:hypothetical protein
MLPNNAFGQDGQWTIIRWHTDVEQLITFLAPRYRTWAVEAVRCKIANCSLKTVKGTHKLEYTSKGLFSD